MAKKEKKPQELFSSNRYNDNYREVFSSGAGEMVRMSTYLNDWQAESKWMNLSMSKMSVSVESGGPLIIQDVKSRYTFLDGTEDEAIQSTIENGLELGSTPGAQMILTSSEVDPYRSYSMCLSDTGLYNLVMRAGVDCSSIWKSTIAEKKTMLDIGLRVSGDKQVLALYSNGKIRTFNGYNTYCILKQSEMFDAIIKMLVEQYKEYQFNGGYFSYNRTVASFELSKESSDNILELYSNMVEGLGSTKARDLKVQFEFSTSEVGEECATISVFLARGELRMLIGSAIKIPHTNGMTTERFIEGLPQLLAKTKDLVSGLTNLINIKVKNPVNCMVDIAKTVGLSKNPAMNAIADFENMMNEIIESARENGEPAPVFSAHDVFYVLQEALLEMRKKSTESSTQKCEENLSRLLVAEFDWESHDVALRPEWTTR